MNTQQYIKVWDLPVRVFHWSLVASFTIAYLSGEELLGIHAFFGYIILGLIGFRLIWGVIGTRHALFTDFVRRPAVVTEYLKDVVGFRAKRYIGHNPAGGAMVIALLLSLLLTTLSGLVVYGGEEMSGPLADVMRGSSSFVVHAAEEVHEFFANFTVVLVALHVIGVIVASLQHNENLVRSMFNGLKPRQSTHSSEE